MPHVDVLYAQLQKHQISSTFIQTCFINFVNNAREKIPDVFHNDSCVVNEEPLAKRTRSECFGDEVSMILGEVYDICDKGVCYSLEVKLSRVTFWV